MKEKRKTIPKVVSESVLAEYRHKCAVCGEDRPHLHHIDENPTNNSELNLLPLCPNCHLSDQHNPTSCHAPKKLSLFRIYKDPSILKPQFQAIFERFSFLYVLEDLHGPERLREDMDDLLAFIRAMEMGDYYSPRIDKLLTVQPYSYTAEDIDLLLPVLSMEDDSEAKETERALTRRRREQEKTREWAESQRAVLSLAEDDIVRLIVESLRFQKW